MESYSKVPVNEPDWLIKEMVPIGMVTVLVADPEAGKDIFGCGAIASLSRGDPMPCGTPTVVPAGTVMVTPEDPADIVVKPRLIAARADTDTENLITDATWIDKGRTLKLPRDFGELERAVDKTRNCRLVWMSPIRGATIGCIRSDDKMREMFAELDQFAADKQLAAVFTHHYTKTTGRVAGTPAIVEYPRMVLSMEAKPNGLRVVRVEKSNIVRKDEVKPIQFTIRGESPYSYAEFVPLAESAEEADEDEEASDYPQKNTAAWFILECMRDRGGPCAYAEIIKDTGLAGWTVRVKMGILHRKGLVAKDAPGVYHAVTTVTTAPDQGLPALTAVTGNGSPWWY